MMRRLELLRSGNHPCDLPGLQLCRTVDESKAINYIRGSVVIIAGSGMCNGGRVKHHLVNNLVRQECTILFVGYQASRNTWPANCRRCKNRYGYMVNIFR